ncbi:hypothetical protein A2U01_0075781, partial [Trifolium medium]|nr:hypothetical protein [Trifolium medium]
MSSRVTRFLGKGKKSYNTDPQQPPKKKKLTKGVGSKSGPGGSSHAPPALVLTIGDSDTARPSLLQPFSHKFFCEARME